ncbi:hypothetical protein GOODEAATRI_031118 [Goodea atripinnis]|uniref:Uncharacterized protein n=1 Tax=Goodea atripinnis TaxID=208336 RepID=A0ABV0N5P6_9TELE
MEGTTKLCFWATSFSLYFLPLGSILLKYWILVHLYVSVLKILIVLISALCCTCCAAPSCVVILKCYINKHGIVGDIVLTEVWESVSRVIRQLKLYLTIPSTTIFSRRGKNISACGFMDNCFHPVYMDPLDWF